MPRHRILLITTAVNLGTSLKAILEHDAYDVVCVEDHYALEASWQTATDLVILEWTDDIRLLRYLRQSATVPILVITTLSKDIGRVANLDVLADDYITKPFGTHELLARIRILLRRYYNTSSSLPSSGNTQHLRYATISLDKTSYSVTAEGDEVSLTLIEFRVLELLLGAPGRVFTREELVTAAWGNAYIGGDRSVDHVVSRLRKKLSALDDAIQTVWGIGYRLRVESTTAD